MTGFHPSPEMLLDYASGALHEAPALIIATHLALCPTCRGEVCQHEELGGHMLEKCEEVHVSSSCREKVLAAIEQYEVEVQKERPLDLFLCRTLPSPLRSYVGCGVANVPWKKVAKGVDSFTIAQGCKGGQVKLLRVAAGHSLPAHTHKGTEYTLVLSGSYLDGDKRYTRGDMSIMEASDDSHRPVADAQQDCICLIVNEGPIVFSNPLLRLLSPFIRH